MSFGQLKGRWRILLKRIDINYSFVPNITSACCILHNLLVAKNEEFVQQWLNEVTEAQVIYQQPIDRSNRDRDDITGSIIRQHLTDYLAANYPLRRSVLR
ncbi:hypothetical protein ALC57_13002 [Trachymyrmex cornetzi]|uniref:DDE Tnp4 domain-containing protein n=2 Tax=Trachymyrmex cornetzi TaxID=471704 RepID=A0A151J080_9HYME|nr:hypothetical protein ALC57_13002 [Trachymyrmex cornetzi]